VSAGAVHPRPGASELPGGAGEDGLTVTAPPVVAVVVTRNSGPWLEPALEAIGSQDYPDLTALVIDAGSADDPTPRIAAVLPGAYVRRLDGDPGFASAANEALSLVEGAAFVFLCHDDVTPDPDAVRLMVEEAYRSNAGIVGPKLVGDPDASVLLEVGMSIDRFGAAHSEIEPGELDQEQHDAVRDVFYVSSAAMLVRFDLFAELAGFDASAYPGSEDLDLCWRARIAGARVMVAPDARVRHREAASERSVDDAPTADQLERSRLRSVLVAYSRPSLLVMVPWTFVHTIVESIVFVVTGDRDRAGAVWHAWFWNARRFKDLRVARARAQSIRRVPDRELRALQTRGSARARRFFAQRLRPEETVQLIGDTGRVVADRAQRGVRQPIFVALALAVLMFAIGSRSLYFDGIPQVGQLADWDGVSGLLRAFGSGWRDTLLGSPTPAPPLLALLAVASLPFFGATGFAETMFVLVSVPVGAVGVMHLVRRVSGEWISAAAAGLAYLLLPVWRNAIANGRLGPLVFLALAPFLVHLVLAAAGATRSGDVAASRVRLRWFELALLGALLTAVYPPSLLVGLAVALAVLGSAPLVGGVILARNVVVATLVAGAGAVVILFPWPLAVVLGGADPGSIGFGFRPRLDVGEVFRMSSGPAGSRWSALGLLLAGMLVLAVGRGPRLAWGVRAWALALVGFLATWLPVRFAPGLAIPAPEATLAVFALGVALAVGLGVAAFVEDLRGQHFGWRQGVSLAAFVALGVSSLGFLGDSLGGRWHAPRRDWPSALAFTANDELGSFRVLWIGDPTVLPLDAVVDDEGMGYVLTIDGAGDATDSLRAPTTSADGGVSRAISAVRDGRTTRFGHVLAPMAVRYVIVPERVGPRGGTRAGPPADLTAGLDGQVDLAKLVRTDDDLSIYENTAWLPMEAVVAEAPAADAERASLNAPTEDGGVLLWSQASNEGWRATRDGDTLERLETFGWANGFVLDGADDAAVSWARQWQRNVGVAVQLALVVAIGVLWWRRRAASGSVTMRASGPRVEGDREPEA